MRVAYTGARHWRNRAPIPCTKAHRLLCAWRKSYPAQCPPKAKGVAERGSRTKGWWGGVRPKAEKKIVTSPILMAEVVVDVPKGTSDGSPGVRHVFEAL